MEALRWEAPTWERVLSEEGNTPEAWGKVLSHLGALALVRNLKNLFAAGFTLQDLLPHAERVDVRDLYPHQLFRAYEEVEEALPLLDRLFFRMVEARPSMEGTLSTFLS